MKNRVFITLTCALAMTSAAAIADTAAANKTAEPSVAAPKTTPIAGASAKTIKPMQMTCEEFLSYDEVTRPQIVFLSEGLNGKGKAGDAVFDIERTNTLVPILVEECQREPKTSYWQKMKNEFKRVF
jgi:hypothetical protein